MSNKDNKQKPQATVLQVAKAVMSAFMGIRRKSDHEFDAETLKPAQVIIGGLIGGASLKAEDFLAIINAAG